MARTEVDMPPAGDDAAEVKLAGELRAAVNRAVTEHRMTHFMLDGCTAAAVVPVGVALALEPSTVRLAGDVSWTELPSGGMACPAGIKVTGISWHGGPDGKAEASHADGSRCEHTMSPADEPAG